MLAARARSFASYRRTLALGRPARPAASQLSVRAMADGGGASAAATVRVAPVAEANALRDSGILYLDVRTPAEFAAGHPPGAVNVDFLGASGPDDFVAKVQAAAPVEKGETVVVGCKSGRRSANAAALLAAAGYAAGGELVDVGGGFDAWSAAGLPVET